jgi:hypothetical protein
MPPITANSGLTIRKVTNLRWTSFEQTMFECDVEYDQFPDTYPAGINATDEYQHIRHIWNEALSGVYGVIQPYIPSLEEVLGG